MLKNIAELTLDPSRDEILPVRSQEPADQCLPDENKLAKISSVPLGMESIASILKLIKTQYLHLLRPKDLKQHNFSGNAH